VHVRYIVHRTEFDLCFICTCFVDYINIYHIFHNVDALFIAKLA
jgi:hypothetical protein